MYTALSSLEEGQVKNDINKIEKHICRFCLDAQKNPTELFFCLLDGAVVYSVSILPFIVLYINDRQE